MSERLVEELTDTEITFPQMQVMRHIYLHQNVTIGDIARGLDISYPSATNMIHRLTRKGLVMKDNNVRDKRLVKVSLTNKGISLVNNMADERTKRFAKVLEKMNPDHRDELIKGLIAFVQTALDLDMTESDEICLRCGLKRDPNCPVAERQGQEFCR